MQLSLPPENSSTNKKKIAEIQQQKKRLRDRIQKLKYNEKQSTDQKQTLNTTLSYEQNMTRLLERKKKLQQQKEKQYMIKKMQEQYIERQKQMEREKRMQQLQNEKRMIELEAGIKRLVFEGTKQKVKGMNSEQLLMRAMLRDGQQTQPNKNHRAYTSKGNIRRDFQAFLQKQHRNEYKQKWDICDLNQKRLKVFEQKQQALMREILLKQLISKGKDDDIDVLKLNKKQLEDMLQQYGIDITDYMQTIMKQQIIQALPDITKQSQQRIKIHEKKLKEEQEEENKLQKQRSKLKQYLLLKDKEMVSIAKSIIYDIINRLVFDYEKRLNRYQLSEFAKLKQALENRYEEIILESDDYQYAKLITLRMLEEIHDQFTEEAAEEVVKLHDFAHTKTEECFEWMFAKGTNIVKKLQDVENIGITLNFTDDSGEQDRGVKRQIQKEDYLKKFQDYQTNVFDVDKLTTQLINQINILEVEKNYFDRISIKIHGEKEGPQGTFHILYDRQFYAITNDAVHNAKKIKTKLQKLGIDPKLTLLHWQKFHNFWLIHDNQKVSLYSAWGLEQLKNDIGQRLGNLCGKIISTQIFPIFTILGQACSIMLGFEKGQILKYNMNLNRIENTQSNLAFYQPILPQIKSGEQPPFPLQKKNTIKVQIEKITERVQIHQFRQFFQHHTTSVISINFYKHNIFITVDKSMKCAIWYYEYKEGPKCYSPVYTFQFIPSYQIYRESQNPRFTNIYPGPKLNQSAEQLYTKWMQGEGFLRRQIFNNPKKNQAFYRPNDDKQQKGEAPLWKFTYDEGQKRVLRIHQSYFDISNGKMQAKTAKIWRKYLMILCERDHIIREDLKTIKVYGWDIQEHKMRSICIQCDVYKSQATSQFEILDNMLVGVDVELLAIVSSGRIIIFSLISGQLLRNLSEASFLQNPKYASYFYTQITAKRSLLGAATKTHTMEISFNDHNSAEDQKELNELIQQVARKYINLL